MEAFLVTRIIFTGAGTLNPDGEFALSEKATAATGMARGSAHHHQRVMFDCGNLLKDGLNAGLDFTLFRLTMLRALFSRRQRFQIGLSDANRLQYAEHLKIGTTLLVLEMAESGWLDDAPRFSSSLKALHVFNGDPDLRARSSLRCGIGAREAPASISALETQRFYLNRARAYVARDDSGPSEFREIVRLWEETLDLLENDRHSLVGALDWVTKKHLLETSGAGQPHEVRKKIDLRYHQLGDGYADAFEARGLAARHFGDAELERAMVEPPTSRSARRRAQFVRRHAGADRYVRVGWRYGFVGFLGRRVTWF
jgi:proteasome accessory factor A